MHTCTHYFCVHIHVGQLGLISQQSYMVKTIVCRLVICEHPTSKRKVTQMVRKISFHIIGYILTSSTSHSFSYSSYLLFWCTSFNYFYLYLKDVPLRCYPLWHYEFITTIPFKHPSQVVDICILAYLSFNRYHTN